MQIPFSLFVLVMCFVRSCESEKKSPSEDFFKQELIQGSSWRTIGYEEQNDPKKIFFSRLELNEKYSPTSDGSTNFDEEKALEVRNKRQTYEEIMDSGTVKINTDIEDELSTQQQELVTQDTLQLSTESFPSTTEITMENTYSQNNFIPINDFIRFRRELIQEARAESVADGEINSKSTTQNFDMENENLDAQNSRGPRGLSTQEWVKFPYQVQRVHKSDDSYASPSDFTKPRRVQFVTQKQFQVENPLSSNSRQGRVADQPRQSRDQPREPRVETDVRKGQELFTPRFRDFGGPEYPFRYSRGRYYERDLMDRRPDSRSLEMYPRNRDRRIIYYANLPEIPRISPRFRDMGRYRDPFEDRYMGSQFQRGFYRDQRNEELHPMKVSADINVRDVKKNPEKRIYSDVKRKFEYDIPPFDADQPTRH